MTKGQIIIEYNIEAKTELCEGYDDDEFEGLTDEQIDEKYDNPTIYLTKQGVEEVCIKSLKSQLERVLEDFEADENAYTCDDLQVSDDFELKDIIEVKELKIK